MSERTPGEGRLSAATALASAALAASCCLLPIALIVTGLAGAGLMMTMMRYEWLTLRGELRPIRRPSNTSKWNSRSGSAQQTSASPE